MYPNVQDMVHIYKGIMSFAATGLDLETVILSEVSQTEKDKYHMISFVGRI